jgi:hypothetical protein
MLSVTKKPFMLIVIMLSVVMLNVVAPQVALLVLAKASCLGGRCPLFFRGQIQ